MDDSELASRYHVQRTWRQIRNGGSPSAWQTTSADDRKVGVGLSLQRRELVQPWSDLVQNEKRDRGRNADVPNEAPHRVE
jgi:hypothetical protein